MTDPFLYKNISPMLIKTETEAFDSSDYLYELKLDGERCIAYLDKDRTDLKNKRNILLNAKVPELCGIHRQTTAKCVLDGELIVMNGGKPDFFAIQKRSLTSNRHRIELLAEKLPASYVAYDILYYGGKCVMNEPLTERKRLLSKAVKVQSAGFALSQIYSKGVKLFELTVRQGLEGVVAKRKDSKYIPGTRTDSWLKFKNLKDDDFVICGYIPKENNVVSLLLGKYEGKKLLYKGHVTLGRVRPEFELINKIPAGKPLFDSLRQTGDNVFWLRPRLVCTVKYLMKTSGGGLRHPVFKGLRPDKSPEECTEQR